MKNYCFFPCFSTNEQNEMKFMFCLLENEKETDKVYCPNSRKLNKRERTFNNRGELVYFRCGLKSD